MVSINIPDLPDDYFEDYIKYELESLFAIATPELQDSLLTTDEFYDDEVRNHMYNREPHMNESYEVIEFVEESGQYYCHLENPTSAFYFLFYGHNAPYIESDKLMKFYWTNGSKWMSSHSVRSNTHPDTPHHLRFRGFISNCINKALKEADEFLTDVFKSEMRIAALQDLKDITEYGLYDLASRIDDLYETLSNFKEKQFLYESDWNEFEGLYEQAYLEGVRHYESRDADYTDIIYAQEEALKTARRKKVWGAREAKEQISKYEKLRGDVRYDLREFQNKAYNVRKLIR